MNAYEMYQLDIPIDPVGKGRPRFTKEGHTYTPSKTANAERTIAWHYRASRLPLFVCPVAIKFIFYFPVPKSYNKSRRQNCLNGLLHPAVKPDIDNCTKLVMDALNGVAYTDDKNVIQIEAQKKYDEKGHIEIYVWRLNSLW